VVDTQAPVGIWFLDEGSGTLAADASGLGNDGSFVGSPAWDVGVLGSALRFSGDGSRVLVPDADSLDVAGGITIAAWIRPTQQATQYVIKKARRGFTDGYELSLSSGGAVYVRFNQASSGNAYRLDSATVYPTDGNTWVHVAATFDGQTIRLYLDGILEASLPAAGMTIAANGLPLSIGAEDDGFRGMSGSTDEVYLHGYALTETEVQALVAGTAYADTDGDGWIDSQDAFPNDPTEWVDTDGDGIGNDADPDDDNDGMPDSWEALYGLDPLGPSDATEDGDRDGVSNHDEFLQDTDP
jgi:hypothetical protein